MVSTNQVELHISLLLSEIKGQICSCCPDLSFLNPAHICPLWHSAVWAIPPHLCDPKEELWPCSSPPGLECLLFGMDTIQNTQSCSFSWRTLRVSWILLMGNVQNTAANKLLKIKKAFQYVNLVNITLWSSSVALLTLSCLVNVN